MKKERKKKSSCHDGNRTEKEESREMEKVSIIQ